MSLFKAVKSVFGGGRESSENRLCVVDAERMVEGRDAGPGDRFQVLQRLGRFAEREKVEMQAVFAGRPLREAEHGGEFMGIKVFYAESGQNYIEQFLGFVKDAMRRDKVMVITNDVELEKRVTDIGCVTLRSATLRKAFEGGEDRGDRGDRGPRRRGGRGGRGGRRDSQGGGRRDAQGGGDQGGGSSAKPNSEDTSSGSQSSVKNLIDLVE